MTEAVVVGLFSALTLLGGGSFAYLKVEIASLAKKNQELQEEVNHLRVELENARDTIKSQKESMIRMDERLTLSMNTSAKLEEIKLILLDQNARTNKRTK
jgi:predicted  nucleic acid-binding Zn-ribbon protein